MYYSILFVLMFLFIYAPKIAGRIDALSMICILLFLIAVITSSFRYLCKASKRRIFIYTVFFFLMVLYSYLLIKMNGISDAYQPLRFGRCFINTLGAAGLISLYYMKYKRYAAKHIIEHLWLCLLCHACIMIFMYLHAGFNSFVIDRLRQVSEDSRAYEALRQGMRISGLTGSWDATSGVQALCIMLLPAIWPNTKNKILRQIKWFSIPISLFAMALSGVTGFVVLTVGGIAEIMILTAGRRRMVLVSSIVVSGLVVLSTSFALIYFQTNSKIYESSISRTAYMLFGDSVDYILAGRISTAQETFISIAKRMYFLPNDISVLLFGYGGSGRNRSEYYIAADNGIILNIHNIGIVCSIILYSLILYDFIQSFKMRYLMPFVSLVVCCVIFCICLIDAKIQYVVARNSLSLMMIVMIMMWQELGYARNRMDHDEANLPA